MKKLLILMGFSILFANDYDKFLEQLYATKDINKTLLKKLEKKYPKAYAVEKISKKEQYFRLKRECIREYNKSACKILADAFDFIKNQNNLANFIMLSGSFDGYDVKNKFEKAYIKFVKAIVNDDEKGVEKAINEILENSFFIDGNEVIKTIGILKHAYPNIKVDKYQKLTKNILKQKKIFTISKLYAEYEKSNSISVLKKLLTYPQNKSQKDYLKILLAETYIKDNPKKALQILENLPNNDDLRNLFLAETYINLKEYNKAIKLLKSLPQKRRILRDLMIVYYKLKDYNKGFEYAKTLDRHSLLEFAYKVKKQDIYIKTLKVLGAYKYLLKRKKVKYVGYQFEMKNQQIIMQETKTKQINKGIK